MSKIPVARLVALNEAEKCEITEIRPPFNIGRDASNDLVIGDGEASRKHAVIELCEDRFVIRDLKSANGTFVNDRPVERTTLNHLDEVRVGGRKYRFMLSEPAQEDDLSRSVVLAEDAADVTVNFTTIEASIRPTEAAPLNLAGATEIYKRYETLIDAIETVTETLEIDTLLERVARKMFSVFYADRMAVLLLEDGQLKPAACITKHGPQKDGRDIRISTSIANRVVAEHVAVLIQDAHRDDRFAMEQSIVEMGIRSAMCAPLVHRGESLGIIYLDSMGAAAAFTEDDLRMLSVISRSVSIAIRNARFLREVEAKGEELRRAYLDTISVLANTIEARDHYTVGHTWRVTHFSRAIAEELGWPEEKLREVEMGGVLHDVGKIGVDDQILRKPGKLSDEEYEIMKFHPGKGAQILKDIAFLKPVIPYVLCHQERWDGKGYPAGLRGEAIPPEGRLVAVADTFDAMTSDRPYRKGMPPEKAIGIIREVAGSQLDPTVVEAFLRVWNAGRLANIMQNYNVDSERSAMCTFCSTWINLDADIAAGDTLDCPVCGRKLAVVQNNGRLEVKLV